VRIYFGTPGFGWRMYGIGYKSVWFLGFSSRIQEGARWSEPNLVHIQFEQETDGRWIAEVPERPGVRRSAVLIRRDGHRGARLGCPRSPAP